MLGHALELSCAKFLGNWFRIDGEIDKKHALQLVTLTKCYWLFLLKFFVAYASDESEIIHPLSIIHAESSLKTWNFFTHVSRQLIKNTFILIK